MSSQEKEKTLRELIKENQSRIWWEEEPAPNNVISVVIEWLEGKRQSYYENRIQHNCYTKIEAIEELIKELRR